MSQYGENVQRRVFDPAIQRSAYVPHERVWLVTRGESRTQQHMAAECDINNIVQRYMETGILDHTSRKKPSYGDVASGMDFQEAMQTVTAAREMFGALPSSIRREFDNDPAKFLDFANDPANAEALVEMGLSEPVQSDLPGLTEKAAEKAPVKKAPEKGSESPVEPKSGE